MTPSPFQLCGFAFSSLLATRLPVPASEPYRGTISFADFPDHASQIHLFLYIFLSLQESAYTLGVSEHFHMQGGEAGGRTGDPETLPPPSGSFLISETVPVTPDNDYHGSGSLSPAPHRVGNQGRLWEIACVEAPVKTL